jgi:23S rRNA (adenine1618-N6)-methyltransferase
MFRCVKPGCALKPKKPADGARVWHSSPLEYRSPHRFELLSEGAMHPRNRHQTRYDFARLVLADRELARFLRPNPRGDQSLDFADPDAVLALNRALLRDFYGISKWQIPPGYLCPPIPGRADYVHHVADLLATSNAGAIPRGDSVAVLDIGVGANCIYPIIGVQEYGWRFVGSDIDLVALDAAKRIVAANPPLRRLIECRLQSASDAVFTGVVQRDEIFDVSICNPPFHASAADATAGTRRKLRNLAGTPKSVRAVLNFGGRSHELWCHGGEAAFVRRMILESVHVGSACLWFSSLVSRSENVAAIHHTLRTVEAVDVRTIDMSQGQKKSRIIAWTFLGLEQHHAWAKKRWR